MTAYGDVTSIKRMLAASGTVWGADDEARIDALNAALSLEIEWKTGRTFGADNTATALDLVPSATPRQVLPRPLKTVTAVYRQGNADEPVDPVLYRLAAMPNRGGEYWFLDRLDGISWVETVGFLGQWWQVEPALLTVVGEWADADVAAVPDDLVDAVNVLVVEFFKQENASASGFVGPDGQYLPFRDPWKHGRVAPVLDKYGAVHELVFD